MSVGPLHLHLLVPGLFGPFAGQARADFPMPDAPLLRRMLARGHLSRVGATHAHPLYALFGYSFDTAQMPPDAWLSYQADSGRVPAGAVMLAAPVHLRADRTQLVLFDAASVGITAAEAQTLVQTLTPHLAESGMQLEALQPDRWYLHLPSAPRLQCTALTKALGQTVDPLLPRGAEARRWHTLLNEIQMLLHDAPVNQQRARANRPALNSLWLWGGGSPLTPVAHRWQRLWAQDPLARGLAQLNRLTCSPPPAGVAEWLHAVVGDRHLLMLDHLQRSVAYGDIEQWRADVAAMESDWFAPLWSALRSGRLRTLCLDGGHCRIELTRRSCWKFWQGEALVWPGADA